MAPLSTVQPSAVEPYLVDVDRRAPHPLGRRVDDQRVNARAGRTGCRIVDLPRVADPRGNLTFVEGDQHIPFPIARVYYLYDVPGGTSRGGHAHKQLEALIIAATGSFDVSVDDGVHQERFFLNRSYHGLYVPRMTWRELDNFSSGGVCLVLASAVYEEDDYVRDHGEFLAAAHAERAEQDAA
ncbi:MAG: WxcM-like protein [Solirubrobacterales bacterium]|nr:WxcM-like protein [Solirubrobacterales bacterium]